MTSVLATTEEETTTVGRWMSVAEFEAMQKSGLVQESFSGTTHVAWPANPLAYLNQAKPFSVYVEFEVTPSSLKQTQEGWAKIVGPNSLESRRNLRKGLPVPQMPPAANIRQVASRIG